MIGASGRAALILLAAVFLCLGGAVKAAPSATSSTKSDSASSKSTDARSIKHRRHTAHRHTSRTAEKSADNKDAPATADNETPSSNAMPPAIANANAQLAAAGAPAAAAATALTDRAKDNVQAASENAAAGPASDNRIVESDQLNDVDRTLQQDNSAAQKTVVAASDAQPRPAPVMAASHADSSAWDESSLIGKIFIGVGALLTLASAARMFMA